MGLTLMYQEDGRLGGSAKIGAELRSSLKTVPALLEEFEAVLFTGTICQGIGFPIIVLFNPKTPASP